MASDKLSDRLRGMLLETSSSAGGDNGVQSSPASRPLIEVVATENHEADKSNTPIIGDGDNTDSDADDDCPPPISFHGMATAKSTQFAAPAVPQNNYNGIKPTVNQIPRSSPSKNQTNDAPTQSLAEQLLAEATTAKQKQQQQQTQRDKQRVKKSTFGMKKGFLNSSTGKKKKGGSSSKKIVKKKEVPSIGKRSESQVNGTSESGLKRGEKDESDPIYELDSDGNMIPSKPSTKSNSNGNKNNNSSNNPLHLPEVQSAMLNHLQSTSSQWATPELLDSISQNHPKLAHGMSNPKYMAALQSMQHHPKETIDRLRRDDPEIMEWLLEFCGVMGEHFVKLGEEHDGKKDGNGKEKGAKNVEDARVREMGPLEKKALEKHQQQKQKQSEKSQRSQKKSSSAKQSTPQTNSNNHTRATNNATNNEMDNQVASILANDELRSILMDPKMQQIMEECTTGIKLRYYMSHPEVGPKLRMLMEAGLLRFA